VGGKASKHDRPGLGGYGVRIVQHGTSEPPRRSYVRISALVIVLAIIGLFIWSEKHLTNTYAITPGLSQPVGPLIKVSGHPHSATRVTILLTDVFLTQLTTWQWLIDQLHPPAHAQFVSGDQLIGPNVPTAELYTQSYLEMYDSQNYAKVAAMRSLHLRVAGNDAGATVVEVATNAPASHVVSVADRIVWARGHAVSSRCGFIDAMSGAAAGRPVELKVEYARIANDGSITGYSRPKLVESPTSAVPASLGPTGCAGHEFETAWLGIGVENAFRWTFPVVVSINTANIGGPSAGLAMTLGIIDALSKTSITGDLKIAATGTIDPNGIVGDVGGVAEKTIAVENAGATVFLVPTAELGVARKAASGGLKVIAVDTLTQALAAIRRLGGSVPVPISGQVTNSARA
jgi:PDZ domain-containing protein